MVVKLEHNDITRETVLCRSYPFETRSSDVNKCVLIHYRMFQAKNNMLEIVWHTREVGSKGEVPYISGVFIVVNIVIIVSGYWPTA